MLTHCATCSCGAPARPLADDPEWLALMARRAETDAELEAMFAEAERLLGKGGRGAE